MIDDLYGIYPNTLLSSVKAKNKAIEDFRKQEGYLREYYDRLSDLERAARNASLYSYNGMSSALMSNLANFNPKDVQGEIEKLKAATEALIKIKDDIQQVAANFDSILSLWESFKTRNKNFIKETFPAIESIEDKISTIREKMDKVSLNDIPRLDNEISKEKDAIIDILSNIEYILDTYQNKIFIGQEAETIKSNCQFFIEKDLPQKDLTHIAKTASELKNSLENTPNEKTETPVEVIEVSDEHDTISEFAIDMMGEIVPMAEIDIASPSYRRTGTYLYLSNYPSKGIFDINNAIEDVKISPRQIESINEIREVSKNYFILFAILEIFISAVLSLGWMPAAIGISLQGLVFFLFLLLFNKTPSQVVKKRKIKPIFIYEKIDYYITSSGFDTSSKEEIEENIKSFLIKTFGDKQYG